MVNTRTENVKKNILASLFFKFANMGISFLMVPITLNYLNVYEYGVWVTLSSIILWITYFDVGLGNGLRNKLTEALSLNDFNKAKCYVSTTYFVMFLFVVIISIFIVLINPYIKWEFILKTSGVTSDYINCISLLVVLLFCFQFFLRLIGTIVIADQKPAVNDFLNFVTSVISLAGVFLLNVFSNSSLLKLSILISSVPIVVFLFANFYLFYGKYRIISPSFKSIEFVYLRELFGVGLKFFILQISALVIYQTNNIIISQIFGPADVTVYNIAYKYFNALPMLFIIILTPYWSAFTDAYVKRDFKWMKYTINNLLIKFVYFVLITLLMLVFSNLVYRLWVGEVVVVPIKLSIMLALYNVVFIWGSVFIYPLNGIGKLKMQFYSSIIEMIIAIPTSVFLGYYIGVEGVILGMILSLSLRTFWAPIQLYKIINNKALGIWNK